MKRPSPAEPWGTAYEWRARVRRGWAHVFMRGANFSLCKMVVAAIDDQWPLDDKRMHCKRCERVLEQFVSRAAGGHLMDGPVYVKDTMMAYLPSSLHPEKAEPGTRVFGPKDPEHPTVGRPCPGCQKPFTAGDFTVLIPVGPGDSEEQQQKARQGRYYRAVALELHVACATGQRYP